MNIDSILDTLPQDDVPTRSEVSADTSDRPDVPELDDFADQITHQDGIRRAVNGARLVSKHKSADGSFTELWIYRTERTASDAKVLRAILAGTDIPVGASQSPDGSQTFSTWACGNIEFVEVFGMPN